MSVFKYFLVALLVADCALAQAQGAWVPKVAPPGAVKPKSPVVVPQPVNSPGAATVPPSTSATPAAQTPASTAAAGAPDESEEPVFTPLQQLLVDATPLNVQSTVAKKIALFKAGKEKIVEIDKFLASVLVYPEAEANILVAEFEKARQKECSVDPVACLSSSSWMAASCESYLSDENLRKAWASVFQVAQTEDQNWTLWNHVKSCSKTIGRAQSVLASDILRLSLNKNWAKIVTDIATWSQSVYSAKNPKSKVWLLVSFGETFTSWRSIRPIPVDYLLLFVKPSISWVKLYAKELTVSERVFWSSVTKDVLQTAGEYQKVIEVVKIIEGDLLHKDAQDSFPSQMFSYCSAQRYLGYFDECLNFLSKFAVSKHFVVTHQNAMTLFEKGDFSASLQRYAGLLKEHGDIPLVKKWSLMLIAQNKFYLNDFKAAQKAFQEYLNFLQSYKQDDDFDNLHTDVVKLRFLRVDNDFKGVWQIIDRQKLFLKQSLRGPSIERLNLVYEAFLTAVIQKNSAKIAEVRKELEPMLLLREQNDFYKLAVSYIENRLKGQSGAVELAQIQKIRTSNNFEFLNIKRALASQ